MGDLARDLRFALRQLRAAPGFTAATLVTLALGIGATTTISSIARAIHFPAVPFADPATLVYIRQHERTCSDCGRMAPANYVTIRDETRTLASVSMMGGWPYVLRRGDGAVVVNGTRVTTEFFRTLGVPAAFGRTLVPDDSAADRNHVVVLSEATWRTQFDADSGVIGRTVVLDATPFTVVGVVADPRVYPVNTGLWTPMALGEKRMTDRRWPSYDVIGRVRGSVSYTNVQADLSTIAGRVTAAYPDAMKDQTFGAVPLMKWQRESPGAEGWLFISAVLCVLLIACINLAGLLMARLATRRHELAVRSALGARPGRVARQLLVETLVLTLTAGALGAVTAAWMTRLVRASLSAEMIASKPGAAHLGLDAGALAIAIATGLLTGLAIGLWPAIRFARSDLVDELRDASRGMTTRADGARLRRVLVVAQVALTIVLVSAAGLLARSAQKLYAVNPGFDAGHVIALRVQAPLGPIRPPIDRERMDRMVQALAALPGVERAGASFDMPYDDGFFTNVVHVSRPPPAGPMEVANVGLQAAGPGYLETLKIPILFGRAIDARDRADAGRVVIVNRAFAEHVFPREDPIDRDILLDGESWRIVGVSGNVLYGRASQPPSPEVIRPMLQAGATRSNALVLRARGDPALLAPSIRRLVQEFDPDLAITVMRPLAAMRSESMAGVRLALGMMWGFAVIAMLTSAIGLYGVVSFSVAQRMREFGVRLALGADSASLFRLVLGQGVRLTAVGGAAGIAGALAVTRAMRSMLFGVSSSDPATYIGAVVVIGATALAASHFPARRAARADPVTLLRQE